MAIKHTISGELWYDLRDGTQLDNGEGARACWGYGSSREVDIEVYHMVHGATSQRHGFGVRFTMSGSAKAWQAIRDYTLDRAEIERYGVGDMNPSMGRRLVQQAEKIDMAIGEK